MIERAKDPAYDPVIRVKEYDAKIVCFDLHWHQQIKDVLDLVRYVKGKLPQVYTVIGGYTASFFYKQLMETYKEIDFLIRGDAEEPLLQLSRVLLSNKGKLSRVSNLAYKDKGKLKVNEHNYYVTEGILRKLNFSRFKLLDNWDIYVKPNIFEGNISTGGEFNKEGGIFFYNCGRGCPYNCSICGGSRISQQIISNRMRIIYSPADAVVQNLRRLRKFRIKTWYNTFDPWKDKTYFVELFRKIRRSRLKLNFQFECLHIPSEEFITAAERTFENIRFDFVLQTGSDSLRRLNKGNFYSNRQLINVLKRLDKTRIKVDLCFVAGLPFTRKENIVESLEFINHVRSNFRSVHIVSETLEMEPASPWHLNSESYEIINWRVTMDDFLCQHSCKSSLGYRTKEFDVRDIQLVKLYHRREADCKKEKSFFLKKISRPSMRERFNLQKAYRFCSKCEYYNDCFGGRGN